MASAKTKRAAAKILPWASPGGKASLVHPSQEAILEARWQAAVSPVAMQRRFG